MKRVFISYAHEDVAFRDALIVHLNVLCTAGVIESWHDGKIDPGENWKGTIERELHAADIILLLVSANFLASRSCQELEVGPAMTRWRANNVLIVPIIIRACDWEVSSIAHLQVLPSQGKPVATWAHQDDAWTEVARKIRAAATRSRTSNAAELPPHLRDSKGSWAASAIVHHEPTTTMTERRDDVRALGRRSVQATSGSSPPAVRQEADRALRRTAMFVSMIPSLSISMVIFAETSGTPCVVGVSLFFTAAVVSAIVVRGSRNTSKSAALKTGANVVLLALVSLVVVLMVKSCF